MSLAGLLLEVRLRICGQVAESAPLRTPAGGDPPRRQAGNILLTQNDEAKLSDFGLSLLSGGLSDQSGTIRGTPLYMSPGARCRGKLLDHRTDLYSVGNVSTSGATVMFRWLAARRCPSSASTSTPPAPTPPRFRKNPEIWLTLEETHPLAPGRKIGAGGWDQAACGTGPLRRPSAPPQAGVDQPGFKRSDPRSPAAPPRRPRPSSGPNAEVTPVNGNGKLTRKPARPRAWPPQACLPRRFPAVGHVRIPTTASK